VTNSTEHQCDRASDGHFGPPATETVIRDWKKVRDLEKINTAFVVSFQNCLTKSGDNWVTQKTKVFRVYKNDQFWRIKMGMGTRIY
jgi:hypothetical protein